MSLQNYSVLQMGCKYPAKIFLRILKLFTARVFMAMDTMNVGLGKGLLLWKNVPFCVIIPHNVYN